MNIYLFIFRLRVFPRMHIFDAIIDSHCSLSFSFLHFSFFLFIQFEEIFTVGRIEHISIHKYIGYVHVRTCIRKFVDVQDGEYH